VGGYVELAYRWDEGKGNACGILVEKPLGRLRTTLKWF
jgi:hypothetical protein